MSDEATKQNAPPPAPPPPPPEPPLVKPDALSEHEVAALVGLLAKTVQFDRRLAANRKAVEELNKEIASDTLLRVKGVSALNLFGFDSTQAKVWTAVREVIGTEAYQRGLDIGNGKVQEKAAPTVVPPPAPKALPAEELVNSRLTQPLKSENHAPPKISDAILAFLRGRNGVGTRAPELREHLKSDYGIETHEKTPGMTLYRLSKEGLVRREGRLWFATDETKSGNAQEKTAYDL